MNCATGFFNSWYSVMITVSIAMAHRAQPGKDSCGIIVLLVNERSCVFGRALIIRKDQECGEG